MADAEKNENEVPLLAEEMMVYPNCPGCKCAHLSARGAGPPVKQLIMAGSVIACYCLPISSLYPYIYFMVEDFHIAKTSEHIGYYAGAIGSIFMFGGFLSAMPWGVFADRYGRRPVMIIGLLSIIVFQTLFGLCGNFWLAFSARLLLGIFNGMLGPLKAYVAEICNAENQAWGLTVVGSSASLGLIVGPAWGGFFARPAINYPGLFSEGSLFARFPYLLPCLCQAVFALFELVVVHYLPETIHKHDECCPTGDTEQKLVPYETQQPPQKRSLWLNRPLMASVAVYCVWAIHEISFVEVFPLWCVSPVASSGLGLLASDVGVVLTISGIGMMVIQLGVFPPLAKRIGAILVTRTPAVLAIPVVILFPFVASLHGERQWIALNVLALIRNSLSSMVNTGSFLLLSNSVPADELGAANGLAVSCVCLCRAVGPAAAGAVFSWCQSRHNAKFLPGTIMVFFILDLVCVLALLTTVPPFLPKGLDQPYAERTMPPLGKLGLDEPNDLREEPEVT